MSREYTPVFHGILWSEKVAALSVEAELLFYRLLNAVGDAGRIHGDPQAVRLQAWTRRLFTPSQTGEQVKELVKAGLLDAYDADGKRVLAVVGWDEKGGSKLRRVGLSSLPPNPAQPCADLHKSAQVCTDLRKPVQVRTGLHKPVADRKGIGKGKRKREGSAEGGGAPRPSASPFDLDGILKGTKQDTPEFREAWGEFEVMRASMPKRDQLTDQARRLALSRLQDAPPAQAVKALILCAESRWKGVHFGLETVARDESKPVNGHKREEKVGVANAAAYRPWRENVGGSGF